MDQQTVRVMDLRSVIIELALRAFAEPEHTCERSHADGRQWLPVLIYCAHLVLFAEKEHYVNICNRRLPWCNDKLVSPCAAYTVEHRKHVELLVLRPRFSEPEISKYRK